MRLLYHAHLLQSSNLIESRLLLLGDDGEIREQYRATSGLPAYQGWPDQRIRGKGPIPRQDQWKGQEYQCGTTPIHMPATPGVAGNFYPITPFIIDLGNGVERGDFGIHFDAGIPGSAGCIVIRSAEGWEAFERQMQKLASANIKTIALQISYSF